MVAAGCTRHDACSVCCACSMHCVNVLNHCKAGVNRRGKNAVHAYIRVPSVGWQSCLACYNGNITTLLNRLLQAQLRCISQHNSASMPQPPAPCFHSAEALSAYLLDCKSRAPRPTSHHFDSWRRDCRCSQPHTLQCRCHQQWCLRRQMLPGLGWGDCPNTLQETMAPRQHLM
jgi:hypothetical protein